jgi:glycosyltransferase involved in cell wall biosynthesis
MSLFRPLPRAECRARLAAEGAWPAAWRRDDFVVGYVGRFVEEKGLDDLIDALEFCPPTTRVLLVGSGPYQAALEARVRERGCGDRVHFAGSRSREDLATAMNALDVLALPSRTTPSWKEQFGRVIIEAHSCGVPVVGSDSGAIPDVIGEGGLVARECDPRSFGEALARMYRGGEGWRIAMGQVGRIEAERNCSWARVGAQMGAVYRHVTGATYDFGPALAGGVAIK